MKERPALRFHNVSYRADGRLILEGVSWTVRRGEHWSIIGPNGAGKTTLLRIACGFFWPNAGGEVLRNGKSLADLRELRKSIGWVTSTLVPRIPPGERALDTVMSGKFAQTGLRRQAGARPTAPDRKRALQYLNELRAAELAAKPFGVLSQGEIQKVLIARARMTKPFLIFLDEPCAGLDPGARERFLASIQRLTERTGAPGLVLVTHHIAEIMPAFKRALAIRDGKVVACGLTERVLRPGVLEALYDIPVKVARANGRYSLVVS